MHPTVTVDWWTSTKNAPYRFVYTLSDALGNTSKVCFTVQGQKTTIAPVEHREKYALKWDKVNYLQEPGWSGIPKGMLYDDVLLNYSVRADSGDIASPIN